MVEQTGRNNVLYASGSHRRIFPQQLWIASTLVAIKGKWNVFYSGFIVVIVFSAGKCLYVHHALRSVLYSTYEIFGAPVSRVTQVQYFHLVCTYITAM